MWKKFFKHPMTTAIIGTLVGTLIGSLIAASVTATNVEKATVELMSKRLEIVEENDTLEEAINKVNKVVEEKETEIDELSGTIKEQDEQIADLTKQVNDETEKNNLNKQIEEKQKEIDTLKTDIDTLQKDKDALQAEYDDLMEKGYEEYIKGMQSTAPVSLRNISNMKNQDIRTDNVGDVSVNGTKFSYYMDTGSDGEAFIEYNLGGKYSQFDGKVYISQWAYENFDPSDSRITGATVALEVKYNDDDDYQLLDTVSGLIPDKDPTPIGGSLIGVKRMRIIFRGGAYRPLTGGWYSIIHLGDPGLYKANVG